MEGDTTTALLQTLSLTKFAPNIETYVYMLHARSEICPCELNCTEEYNKCQLAQIGRVNSLCRFTFFMQP